MRTRITSFLYADYSLHVPNDAKRIIVLLHGYEQSGEKMMEKLKSAIPSDAVILAPNGPFPLPRRTESGYRLGFSWYFWNPFTDEYFVDMEIAVKFVQGLVQEMALKHSLPDLPITLIGFSQGGYLAPFVAQAISRVDHVIGLGCEFLVDEMEHPVKYRMDSVHGALDDIVNCENSKKAHQELVKRGVKGEFHALSETGHRIDAPMQAMILNLLKTH
jgi:predicted esterase